MIYDPLIEESAAAICHTLGVSWTMLPQTERDKYREAAREVIALIPSDYEDYEA